MSYQVLARKWRPKNFQQLMGQEHVVTVLVNALAQQRLHHAYLFTGTRGVGKTTIARIFAKSLNCEQGITATPCGKCDACVDIDQGRFIDLLEIDAASKTKVDDTREILDNVQYAPSRGRYKVYLIDEVHMLSRSSFNALLKTLEEPPEHVKFILATTDPQKLPVTVLSRCLQFHLKALTTQQIIQQLEHILTAESFSFEDEALLLLAKAARGSMRDSLSLTDQAIAQGQGNITLANVQQMLGGVDHNWAFKILIHIIKQDTQGLMQLSQEIASYAPNYSRLLADLIQLLHQIALAQLVEQQFDLSPEQNKLLTKFAKAISPEDVQLYYQIVLNGRKDLPYAADEQAAFDMVILRLLAFKPMTLQEVKNNEAVNEQQQSEQHDLSTSALAETQISQLDVEPLNLESPDTEQLENKVNVEESSIDNLSDNKTNIVQPDDNITQGLIQDSTQDSIQNSELELVSDDVNSPMLTVDINEQPPQLDLSDPYYQQMADNNEQQSTSTQVEQTVNETAEHSNSSIVEEVSDPTVNAILADRNMLRSRRKAQEKQAQGKQAQGKQDSSAKKLNDASERQHTVPVESTTPPVVDLSAMESLPAEPFSPEIIDPAQIKKANQIDKWAHMIDSMGLGGRLRQLAIHATIDEKSTDNLLVLNLDQTTKHLASDNAYQQLADKLSAFFQRTIQVEVNIVAQTEADPYQIQSHINDKRYQYAKELLAQDEIVQTLQRDYQAIIDEDSIKAL